MITIANTTPNLGLHVTPSADVEKKVLDWRNELAGDTADSNMMKLDTAVGALDASKANLVDGAVPIEELPANLVAYGEYAEGEPVMGDADEARAEADRAKVEADRAKAEADRAAAEAGKGAVPRTTYTSPGGIDGFDYAVDAPGGDEYLGMMLTIIPHVEPQTIVPKLRVAGGQEYEIKRPMSGENKGPFLEKEIDQATWTSFMDAVKDYIEDFDTTSMDALLTDVTVVNKVLLLRKDAAGNEFSLLDEFYSGIFGDMVEGALTALAGSNRKMEFFGNKGGLIKEISWYEFQYLLLHIDEVTRSRTMPDYDTVHAEAEANYGWKFSAAMAWFKKDSPLLLQLYANGWMAVAHTATDRDFGGDTIRNVGSPHSDGDAANMEYVNSKVAKNKTYVDFKSAENEKYVDARSVVVNTMAERDAIVDKKPGLAVCVKGLYAKKIDETLWSSFMNGIAAYIFIGINTDLDALLTSETVLNENMLLRKDAAGTKFASITDLYDGSFSDRLSNMIFALLGSDRGTEFSPNGTGWAKEISWYEFQYLILNWEQVNSSGTMITEEKAEAEAEENYAWRYGRDPHSYLWIGDEWVIPIRPNDIGAAKNDLSNVLAATFGAKAAEAGVGWTEYDVVVRNQEEFDALILSDNWLGATSICLVGDGGNRKFTFSNATQFKKGLVVPNNVRKIKGVNGAAISVADYQFNEQQTGGYGVLTRGSGGQSCELEGISVVCKLATSIVDAVSGINMSGISGFTNIRNCTIGINGTSVVAAGKNASFSAFSRCGQMDGCSGSVKWNSGSLNWINAAGYSECKNITNCEATIAVGLLAPFSGILSGFFNCEGLLNCDSFVIYDMSQPSTKSSGVDVACYSSCTNLLTCGGNSYINLSTEAVSNWDARADIFSGCKMLNGCSGGAYITGASTRTNVAVFCNSCTMLSNCAGRGTGPNQGYTLNNCSYINGCNSGGIASTTGLLGGANTFVDTVTVEGAGV